MSAVEEYTKPTPAPGRVGQATAVEQSRAVAEVHGAILVAQQVPRDMQVSLSAMRDSCDQYYLAERAFYRYSRGGSPVTGPSVHVARELARCFQNVQYGINELRRDDEYRQSEMLAWAWDVQMNTRSSLTFIVPHRRDTKTGPSELTDLRDVYENNTNQGSRRLRECVFSILPPWYRAEAVDLLNATLTRGPGKDPLPLAKRVEKALEWFAGRDVSTARVQEKLGKPVGRWDKFDLATLTVISGSIQRGEVSVEDEFPTERVTTAEIIGGQPTGPYPPCGVCDNPEPDHERAHCPGLPPAASP
jgi:hypothetical protein